MGVLAVMGGSGDTKIAWTAGNEDEVANARRTFDDLTDKGYAAFSVVARGEKGEQIRRFNPNAESLILVPPLAGG